MRGTGGASPPARERDAGLRYGEGIKYRPHYGVDVTVNNVCQETYCLQSDVLLPSVDQRQILSGQPSSRCHIRWFRRLMRRLLFRTVDNVALMLDREQAGREASPSASVLNSQTVKAPNAPDGGGHDAAKRTKGRKRHIPVDTDGRGWST